VSELSFLEQFERASGWPTAPAKRRFRNIKKVNRGMEETHRLALTMRGVIDRSLEDLEGLQASDYSSYQIFEADELVFKLIDLENIKTSRVGHVPRRGIMSPAYIRLVPNKRALSRYYYWYFYAAYLNNIFNGMGGGVRQNLTPTDLLEFPIPLPDLDTQKAIADFLDNETARIDQLIGKKQCLVELLGEREKAVPSDLIPSGRMVLQGLLGQQVGNDKKLARTPIKSLFRLAKRQGFPEKTILSVYREHGVIVRDTRVDNINKVPVDVSTYQLVEPGDLVINKMKAWQGSLGISDHEGITSPDYVVMVPTQRMQGRYINHLLRARPMPDFYRAISNGIRPDQWRLEVDRFLATSIYLPSPDEQGRVAGEINQLIASHRKLADRVKASIDRLKEYRSALITRAVTGQIDVTRWGQTGECDKRLDRIQEEMAG
jgi:type I restriction enzyme, S subunit